MKLSDVIESLVEERGLSEEVLGSIICEGMLAAYQKRYPYLNIKVSLNKKSKELVVEVEKQVVGAVHDDEIEISTRKAKTIQPTVEEGQSLWMPFEGVVGRIEIMRAKQVIASRIKEIEASAVFDEFIGKQGHILQGMVHKIERGGVVVKIQDYLAFLPKSLSIPDEKLIVGHPVRALLKEVLAEPRNENQLILDRACPEFVEQLFRIEIPEVFERLVDIKKIVRIAGYKTKVAVVSNDPNIDPVGTCVGVGGVRIKPILKELGVEKVDIIEWTDSLDTLVKMSLKPAEINRVELSDDNRLARVWLDDEQRSLAIGKMGQNVALASRLAGVAIELVSNESTAGSLEKEFEERDSQESGNE